MRGLKRIDRSLAELILHRLTIPDWQWWTSPELSIWQHRGLIHDAGVGIGWAKVQFDLALVVMARMLSLGMSPILPVFDGYVPASVLTRFDVDVVQFDPWGSISCSESCNHWLTFSDPLFARVMARYLHHQALYFGYEATYYHVDVPHSLPSRLNTANELMKISNGLYQSLPVHSVWTIRSDVHDGITTPRAKSELLLIGIARNDNESLSKSTLD